MYTFIGVMGVLALTGIIALIVYGVKKFKQRKNGKQVAPKQEIEEITNEVEEITE